MADAPLTAAIPVVPCNDLAASRRFWERLGFAVASDHGDYLILEGHGTEVHLTRAVEGWLVPGRSPFGVYVRTRDVDGIAARFGEGLVHAPKRQPWGMYEFAVSDPDENLVRVGWPAEDDAR